MNKKLKVLIEKATEVVKIWKDTTMVMDPELERAIPELEQAVKKVKGEA
jgi:hypothetical protein